LVRIGPLFPPADEFFFRAKFSFFPVDDTAVPERDHWSPGVPPPLVFRSLSSSRSHPLFSILWLSSPRPAFSVPLRADFSWFCCRPQFHSKGHSTLSTLLSPLSLFLEPTGLLFFLFRNTLAVSSGFLCSSLHKFMRSPSSFLIPMENVVVSPASFFFPLTAHDPSTDDYDPIFLYVFCDERSLFLLAMFEVLLF